MRNLPTKLLAVKGDKEEHFVDFEDYEARIDFYPERCLVTYRIVHKTSREQIGSGRCDADDLTIEKLMSLVKSS
jgi:hypothetical protein